MCGSHKIPLEKVDFFIVMHHFYQKYFVNNFSFEHTILFTNKFPLPMDGNPPLKNKFL
jgi:hypothetical protein